MDNERLTIWLGFTKFILGTFVLGLVTAFINNEIQSREIELKEIEQLGKFIDHALTEDVGVRKRFAHYFAKVTRSDRLRERWQEYYEDVDDEFTVTKEKKDNIDIRLASETLDPDIRADLVKQAAALEEALKPFPTFSQQNRQPSEEVQRAQKILRSLGYPVRYVDGFMGADTRRAIVQFQTKAGLQPDGILNKVLYDQLVRAQEDLLIKKLKAKIDADGTYKKVELIKWVRSETGWNITELKEFVETVIELE